MHCSWRVVARDQRIAVAPAAKSCLQASSLTTGMRSFLGNGLRGATTALRVRPKTSCGITELSDHQADRGKSQQGKRVVITVLPVLGEPSATVEPSDGPFHDPTFGLDSIAFAASKRLYDLDCQF